jgi:hypothetical protein
VFLDRLNAFVGVGLCRVALTGDDDFAVGSFQVEVVLAALVGKTVVQTIFDDLSPDFSVLGTYLADGNYVDAAYLAVAFSQDLTVIPVEELIIGAVNGL